MIPLSQVRKYLVTNELPGDPDSLCGHLASLVRAPPPISAFCPAYKIDICGDHLPGWNCLGTGNLVSSKWAVCRDHDGDSCWVGARPCKPTQPWNPHCHCSGITTAEDAIGPSSLWHCWRITVSVWFFVWGQKGSDPEGTKSCMLRFELLSTSSFPHFSANPNSSDGVWEHLCHEPPPGRWGLSTS